MFIIEIIMQRKISEKIFFTVIISLLIALHASAQEDEGKGNFNLPPSPVLLSKTVDTTGEIPRIGPNRLFYYTPLCQFGEMPGPQVYGAQTNWWSCSLSYGMRMKLKLFWWNALVTDISYRYDRFSIRQDIPKHLPLGTMNHQRERISIHNFSMVFCDRINFHKRGDVLGSWIDLGVYGDWAFRNADVFVDRHYDSNSTSGYEYKTKTKIAKLPYLEKMNYGLTVRMGWTYGGIFACWRMNNLINMETPNNRDLPKLTIGIEFYLPNE